MLTRDKLKCLLLAQELTTFVVRYIDRLYLKVIELAVKEKALNYVGQ